MKRFQLGIVQPRGSPPPPERLARIMKDVGEVLNAAKAAGAWVLNGALGPIDDSTVVRFRDGETQFSDGPYAEAKEHIGGVLIIRAPDRKAALEWAARLARAVTLPIEVREFVDEG
jgi:hypothetical protein